MSTVTCNLCLKPLTSIGNLNRLIRSIHLKEKWSCDICGKVFSEKQSLLRHEKNMHEVFQKRKQDFVSGTQKRRKLVEDSNSDETEKYTNSEGDSESSSSSVEPTDSEFNEKDNSETSSETDRSNDSSSENASESGAESDESSDSEIDDDEKIKKLKIKLMMKILHITQDI